MEEQDTIGKLVHDKDKKDDENKKVNTNLSNAKKELEKIKSEAESFKKEAAKAKQ